MIPSITQLETCLIKDRYRLRQRHIRLSQQQSSGNNTDELWIQWQQQVDASRAVVEQRSASIPKLMYDDDLPITKHREEILHCLATRQTLVLCGETGSGKSTQLPKLCLEAGLGRHGIIGHTQPRRLAARSVATRVAEELNSKVGQLVGYKIRFSDQTSPLSLIKLMTDGILLAETQNDRFLDAYDTIIIDEAHERSLNIDFLLGYLHRLRAKRPDLRLIITSATIDAERFAAHFTDELGPAPILEVSGRGYPVEIRYRPLSTELTSQEDDEETAPDDPLSGMVEAVDELIAEPTGDILVFLPTERDIREGSRRLRGHFTRRNWMDRFDILPLYARLTEAEQQKIFQPHQKPRIVLATNVAESSLTVPGIRYVIDSGTARISRYAPKSKVQRLPIEPIARAAADQRAGRCGRTAPGICIRLFSEEDYKSRGRFTTPEIRRTDLAAVILQTKVLQLGELEEFPLLDTPQPEMIRDAYRTLSELGAIDDHRRLTHIGKRLGKLPVDPRVGRMILAAEDNQCLAEVLIIAAALECQDVRFRPAEHQGEADAQHAKFVDPWSDFLSYLRLWDFYHALREKHGSSKMQKILRSNFLSFHAFREWSDIQRQLRETLLESGIKVPARRLHLEPIAPAKIVSPPSERSRNHSRQEDENQSEKRPERPAEYEAIHKSLLTGLLSGVAQRGEKGEYQGSDQIKMFLWPGSGLQPYRPTWIVSAEIVETSRRFARCVAEIDAMWVETLAQHIVKRSYSDPHWSSKTQSAMVYERVTLFGLPIVIGRRVQLAPIDPTIARELLIEKGLVEGDLKTSAAFVKHNQAVLQSLSDLANRTRRRDYVIDPYAIQRFYQQTLPEEIVDRVSLEKWDRANRPPAPSVAKPTSNPATKTVSASGVDTSLVPAPPSDAHAVWMRLDNLIETDEPVPDEKSFPKQIAIGESQLPVEYHFEPGSERDGMALKVPALLVPQLSDDRLGWMVEGLLEEKLLAMIRSLPKAQRRNLVPAPDVAKVVATELQSQFAKRPFLQAVCELLTKRAGEAIKPEHFSDERLPDHLRVRLEVVDNGGKTVATGRDLPELKKQIAHLIPKQVAAVLPAASGPWQRSKLTELDVDTIPESVTVDRGGLKIILYPALVDEGESVGWQLVESKDEASRLSQKGWVRLFAIKEKREIKKQLAHFPQWSKIQLHAVTLMNGEKLQQALGDILVRRAFLEKDSEIKTKTDFNKRIQESTRRLSIAVQEMAVWLPQLFEKYHQVRLKLEDAPKPWEESTVDMREQLKWMLSERGLKEAPWKWLQHYPRFLNAMIQRFDKLRTGGPAKDKALMLQVHRFWKDCKTRWESTTSPATPGGDTPLETYRWMIEEYRVSLYAQALGTSLPVSEKRLEQIQKSMLQ
jgi:ATP-dependent helicase HrpA